MTLCEYYEQFHDYATGRNGAVQPKEVLAKAFAEGEIHEKFRAEVYARGGSDA